MSDPYLARLVEIWKQACGDFVALVRDLPEDAGDLPTDLPGWSVRDNLAHTAHLEAVLAGAPEETVEVAEATHLTSLTHYYTEQGVLARRGRTLDDLADELEAAVGTRTAELAADQPTDPEASATRTPGGVAWSWDTLLTNRPLDVWMHEQDVRRAVGRPGGYDGPVADHVLEVFARALPMIWGKRVGAPAASTMRIVLSDRDGEQHTVRIGEDGRAARADDATPSTTITLTGEDYVVLSGGRRTPAETGASVEGDAELGARLLAAMAITP